MKIAILGIAQFNFLNNLYGYVGKNRNDLQFNAIVEKKQGGLFSEKNEIIHEVIVKGEKSLKNYSFILHQFLWKCLIVNFLTFGMRNVLNLFQLFAIKKNIVSQIQDEYDVFHFHFITWQHVLPAYFLPGNKKIIFSFWGSDLLRRSNYLNTFIVKELLRKAHSITVQSIDLREILLAKYGREFIDKVVVVKFISDKQIYDRMNIRLASSISTTKKIAPTNEKMNVVIGHNSKEENNHIKIVEQLISLPQKILNNSRFIFPFSYGRNNIQEQEAYKNSIIELLKPFKIDFTFIEKYLEWEEVVDLRLNTDIFIHLPITDALSGTLTEALYGGAKVITGSWLPYGPFRRSGLKYHEVESFNDLPQKFLEVFSSEEEISVHNRKSINLDFLDDSNFSKWLKLY
ncbi:glycosyltransferase family 4 protein [Antarcticibacterium flavum]|uniref:Glycosyltransferase family 4 protein n=1 Tax=Antarcticibacterium flavum TaxID=2058175 RepID=A0A5B7X068_9FLAO|nr:MULTISPECIES: glycosyltransferase family 4 protein [Antarcticibacterium]MCM4158774.1 hypothetical protein [Antarcticibacterium sp. W02-3]QCY68625.1 glycosyltransferase family 4 protein [Antarcticibacterium flavum]